MRRMNPTTPRIGPMHSKGRMMKPTRVRTAPRTRSSTPATIAPTSATWPPRSAEPSGGPSVYRLFAVRVPLWVRHDSHESVRLDLEVQHGHRGVPGRVVELRPDV